MKSEAVNRKATLVALAAILSCVPLTVAAHGNLGIHIPPWAGPAILACFICFFLLFFAAIYAAGDMGAARWLRIGVPLAYVFAIVVSLVVVKNNDGIALKFFEVFAAFLPPAILAALWLAGVYLRWRRGG